MAFPKDLFKKEIDEYGDDDLFKIHHALNGKRRSVYLPNEKKVWFPKLKIMKMLLFCIHFLLLHRKLSFS